MLNVVDEQKIDSSDSKKTLLDRSRLHKDGIIKYILSLDPHLSSSTTYIPRYEVILMSHLRMSALYWAMASLQLLGYSLSHTQCSSIFHFVKDCRRSDGGFSGDLQQSDSHILYTCSAIQILHMLRRQMHDVSLYVKDIADSVERYVLSLHLSDGSFQGDVFGEVDTRFTYCALLTLDLLGLLGHYPSHIRSALRFLLQCQNKDYDGGFGAVPEAESHAGQVFCVLGALKLVEDGFSLERLFSDLLEKNNKVTIASVTEEKKDSLSLKSLPERERLIDWLVMRQSCSDGGLSGRPAKTSDVCYSWWTLSSLAMLDSTELINLSRLRLFILESQDFDQDGMVCIADRPGDIGDLYHTFFGLAGLAMIGDDKDGLSCSIDPVRALPRDS